MTPRPYARVITVTACGVLHVAAIAAPIAQIIVHAADKNVATSPEGKVENPARRRRGIR